MPNLSEAAPVYLTVEEVAEQLRVCRTTVYTLIGQRADNGFPARKVGASYRVRQTELDAWMRADHPDPEPVPTTD